MESPEEKQPQVQILDPAPSARRHCVPTTCRPERHVTVPDGADVHPGDVLAKIPRETTKTTDITGGLPRVVELFEARKPKEPAVITEIDGVVNFGEVTKGLRKVIVTNRETSESRDYSVPRGTHVNVRDGENVRAGEPLVDGPINPHDILDVLGERALQEYLVNEIQEVYRLQGVNINDKHIEVIVRQMMRWVKVEEVGDTEFLIDEQVDRFRFQAENERVLANKADTGHRSPVAAGHHQGVALDRLVHLGGVLPGDHPGTDRGRDQRRRRPPARAQGERHHGSPDPGRYGILRLQARTPHRGGRRAPPPGGHPRRDGRSGSGSRSGSVRDARIRRRGRGLALPSSSAYRAGRHRCGAGPLFASVSVTPATDLTAVTVVTDLTAVADDSRKGGNPAASKKATNGATCSKISLRAETNLADFRLYATLTSPETLL